MRVESVDEVEIIRRMTEGIYDEKEFQKALAWAKENCKLGFDKNPEFLQKSDEEKEKQFEFVVKMAVIVKDLMNGNKNLPEAARKSLSATTQSRLVSRDRDSGQTSIRTATSQRQS